MITQLRGKSASLAKVSIRYPPIYLDGFKQDFKH